MFETNLIFCLLILIVAGRGTFSLPVGKYSFTICSFAFQRCGYKMDLLLILTAYLASQLMLQLALV